MQTDCPAEYAKHIAQNIDVVTLDDCRKLRDWCLSIGQCPKMDDCREMLEFAVLLRQQQEGNDGRRKRTRHNKHSQA